MSMRDGYQDGKRIGCNKNRAHPLVNKSEYHSKNPSHSGVEGNITERSKQLVEGNITERSKQLNVSPKLLKPTFKPQG